MKKWLSRIIIYLTIFFFTSVYIFWIFGYFFGPEYYSFTMKIFYSMAYFFSSKNIIISYSSFVIFLFITPISISCSIVFYNRIRLNNEKLADKNLINLKIILEEKIIENDKRKNELLIEKSYWNDYATKKADQLYSQKKSKLELFESKLKNLEKELIERENKIFHYLSEIQNLKNKIALKNKIIAQHRGTSKKAIQLIKEKNMGFAIRILQKI